MNAAKVRPLRLVALAAMLASPAVPAFAAQDDDLEGSASHPVIQPIPNADTMQLNSALAQLGRNPRDLAALVSAGQAALAIGDVDAAAGFFRRARQLDPKDGTVKAGLAGALVRGGDPFSAIPLFEEAEAAGAGGAQMASDRGLAYDLVGDSAKAQSYYRRSIALAPSDETLRRLAVSLAITGDGRAADNALAPLLSRGDKAAQRTRTFVYAILGRSEESVAIANSTMPTELAGALAPYLRYMRTLTRPQQAAAANLGVFPRASEIGRDDPRMAAYAPPKPVVVAAVTPTAGGDSGRKLRGRRGQEEVRLARNEPPAQRRPGSLLPAAPAARPVQQAQSTPVAPPPVAPPEPQVSRDVELPPIEQAPVKAQPVRVAQAEVKPAPVAVVAPEPPKPAPAPAPPPPAATSPAPGFAFIGETTGGNKVAAFDLAQSASAKPVEPAPAAAPPPAPPPIAQPVATPAAPPVSAPVAPPPAAPPEAPKPSRTQSLAEAFADFSGPMGDATPAPGAVDIRRIRPAREPVTPVGADAAAKGADPAKPGTTRNGRPVVPSHPSRIWVQVATGRDKAALAFDWRRMARQAASVVRDKRGYISAWGQTNRLLTGPFDSEAAANTFITQLRRADIDGAFVWTSPAGQVVDAIGGK